VEKRIGMSLSAYIEDVVHKKVSPGVYTQVYTDTKFDSPEECIRNYVAIRSDYTEAQKRRGASAVRGLWKKPGKLVQPRTITPSMRLDDEQRRKVWVPDGTEIILVPSDRD